MSTITQGGTNRTFGQAPARCHERLQTAAGGHHVGRREPTVGYCMQWKEEGASNERRARTSVAITGSAHGRQPPLAATGGSHE